MADPLVADLLGAHANTIAARHRAAGIEAADEERDRLASNLSAVLAAARAVASLAVPVPGHGMCILPARIDDLCVALAAADGAP